MRRPIKDKNSNLIGYYKDMSNGDIEVYDKNSSLLGKATNEGTFDKNHRLVMRGKEPGVLLNENCG